MESLHEDASESEAEDGFPKGLTQDEAEAKIKDSPLQILLKVGTAQNL